MSTRCHLADDEYDGESEKCTSSETRGKGEGPAKGKGKNTAKGAGKGQNGKSGSQEEAGDFPHKCHNCGGK